ncbi:MAG: MFS transporter [Actinomycetota bacterium]
MAEAEQTEGPVESPVRELLRDRNFRSFWIAQVLYFGTNGTLRFMLVWLMVTLTDWSAAEGLVGIALGVPALLLALHAGAWSDRADRRTFSLWWLAANAITFAVFALLIALDVVTPRLAGVAAFVIGALLVMIQPNFNAIVPVLVSPQRLMNAAALQNAGAQTANFAGLAFGGLIIALLGNAAGFVLLAVVMVIAFGLMWRVEIPRAESPTSERRSVRSEIMDGLRYGLGSEPRRTLLVATLILGSSFSAMQISMPRVVEEDFGRGSFAAGVLLGTFGIGMLASSMFVASRAQMRHGLNVTLFIGIGLGMGQFLLSLSPNYGVAVAVMIAWGVNAGLAIASHRTLLQQHTEPEMMGRVMGIMTLGFSGGLPFGALVQSILAPAVGPARTMTWVGLATMAITIPLLFRRVIRTL